MWISFGFSIYMYELNIIGWGLLYYQFQRVVRIQRVRVGMILLFLQKIENQSDFLFVRGLSFYVICFFFCVLSCVQSLIYFVIYLRICLLIRFSFIRLFILGYSFQQFQVQNRKVGRVGSMRIVENDFDVLVERCRGWVRVRLCSYLALFIEFFFRLVSCLVQCLIVVVFVFGVGESWRGFFQFFIQGEISSGIGWSSGFLISVVVFRLEFMSLAGA